MFSIRLFILITLLFSANVFAGANLCGPQNEFDDLAAFMKELQWHGATDEQIRNAACARKTPFTDQEMQAWIKSSASGAKESKIINGIQFENESVESLKAFEYLTTPMYGDGVIRTDKLLNFTSQCKKVDCALKEIFGDTSTQLQFMQQKFGFNGSHLFLENRSNWEKEELDTVLLGLSDFPEGVLPAANNRPLVHFKRGFVRPQSGNYAMANAMIEVFDLWNDESPEKKRYTITHELGHVLAEMSGLDQHNHWKNISEWEVSGPKEEMVYTPMKPDNIISRYGKENPAEDFAETVAAYRYNPLELKEKSPEKYALIKEVIFDNVEFTSEESCKQSKRLSESFKNNAQEILEQWKPNDSEIEKIMNACSQIAIEMMAVKGSLNFEDSSIQNCYSNEVEKIIKNKTKASFVTKNIDFIEPMIRNLSFKGLMKKDMPEVYSKHKEKLKQAFVHGLGKNIFFEPGGDPKRLENAYQNFAENLGFDPFKSREQISSITVKIHSQLEQTHKGGRKFSPQDISDQVEKLFK